VDISAATLPLRVQTIKGIFPSIIQTKPNPAQPFNMRALVFILLSFFTLCSQAKFEDAFQHNQKISISVSSALKKCIIRFKLYF